MGEPTGVPQAKMARFVVDTKRPHLLFLVLDVVGEDGKFREVAYLAMDAALVESMHDVLCQWFDEHAGHVASGPQVPPIKFIKPSLNGGGKH